MVQRIALASSLVAVLALAGTAFAGNGGGSNKSSSSISAPVVVSAGAAPFAGATPTAPQFGDTVTFNVTMGQAGDPFVNLVCSKNGVVVYNSWAAFWPSAENFLLSSPAWTSGAASCTANLGMYVSSSKFKVLASTSFAVGA
jgi:hypothetical protein